MFWALPISNKTHFNKSTTLQISANYEAIMTLKHESSLIFFFKDCRNWCNCPASKKIFFSNMSFNQDFFSFLKTAKETE